jgi:hypothetical protein
MKEKLDEPISVFDMGTMTWHLFWTKAEYDNYMAEWHKQQAKQIRRSAYVR